MRTVAAVLLLPLFTALCARVAAEPTTSGAASLEAIMLVRRQLQTTDQCRAVCGSAGYCSLNRNNGICTVSCNAACNCDAWTGQICTCRGNACGSGGSSTSVGVEVGIPVVVVGILLGIAYFIYRRRQQRTQAALIAHPAPPYPQQPGYAAQHSPKQGPYPPPQHGQGPYPPPQHGQQGPYPPPQHGSFHPQY
jgi:hypothetical protein